MATMKQVFIFGASSVYGVGATTSGWADLAKSHLHSKMYGNDNMGEKYEVFNFSKSGSTIEFVAETAPWLYDRYARNGEIMTFVSVGGNDAKAKGTSDNYVCTPVDFERKVGMLLDELSKHSQHVVFVSNGYVDESKTNPKPSPFKDGEVSYFTNERRSLFNAISKRVCDEKGIQFITTDTDEDVWIQNYLYVDGLHPNQAGYEIIFDKIRPILDQF